MSVTNGSIVLLRIAVRVQSAVCILHSFCAHLSREQCAYFHRGREGIEKTYTFEQYVRKGGGGRPLSVAEKVIFLSTSKNPQELVEKLP